MRALVDLPLLLCRTRGIKLPEPNPPVNSLLFLASWDAQFLRSSSVMTSGLLVLAAQTVSAPSV
jgi:hypothetical protein